MFEEWRDWVVDTILINGIIYIRSTRVCITRNNALTSEIDLSSRKSGSVIKILSIDDERSIVTRSIVSVHCSLYRTITWITRMDGITSKSWSSREGDIWTESTWSRPFERITSITGERTSIITPSIYDIISKGMSLEECILEGISGTISKWWVRKPHSLLHSSRIKNRFWKSSKCSSSRRWLKKYRWVSIRSHDS